MEKSLSLYELTAEQQALEDALIENGGELTPELEEMLNANTEALAVKVDGYNKILRKFEGAETAIDAEIKRLTAMKRTAQNSQKSLKAHLLWAMKNAGLEKLEGNLCKASLRHTTSLEVDEEALLGTIAVKVAEWQRTLPSFVTLTAKVSKTAIKDAYPKGVDVLPVGCQYVENESVTIR